MGEFFRGWKRKTGMLTLVLACVFMAGWVRSSFFIEGLVIPLGMKSSASLVSSDSSLIWLTQQGDGFFSATSSRDAYRTLTTASLKIHYLNGVGNGVALGSVPASMGQGKSAIK